VRFGQMSPVPYDMSSGVDESMAIVFPKMKRMRSRPSLGQLRLQREVDEDLAGAVAMPKVQVSVLPEHLLATVDLGSCREGHGPAVRLELSFPPQYPHRPPTLVQKYPGTLFPFWQYDGQSIILARLSEWHWRPAMGVADIVKDLLQSLEHFDGGEECFNVAPLEASKGEVFAVATSIMHSIAGGASAQGLCSLGSGTGAGFAASLTSGSGTYLGGGCLVQASMSSAGSRPSSPATIADLDDIEMA